MLRDIGKHAVDERELVAGVPGATDSPGKFQSPFSPLGATSRTPEFDRTRPSPSLRITPAAESCQPWKNTAAGSSDRPSQADGARTR